MMAWKTMISFPGMRNIIKELIWRKGIMNSDWETLNYQHSEWGL